MQRKKRKETLTRGVKDTQDKTEQNNCRSFHIIV